MRFFLYRIKVCLFIPFVFFLFHSGIIFPQNYVVQTYTQEDGLPSATVHSIIQDKLSRLWIGTRNGVGIYDGLDWTYYNTNNGLQDNEIFCLRRDSTGRIWASSSRNSIHISFYNGSKWKSIPMPSKMSSNIVIRSFNVISNGTNTQLLVSSKANGLFYYKDSNWINITTSDKLPSNYCSNIITHQNKFYAATGAGISIIENGKVDNSLNRIIPESYKQVLALAFEENENGSRLWILSRNCLGYIENNIFNAVNNNIRVKDNLVGECTQFIPNYYGLAIFGNMFGLTLYDYSNNSFFALTEESGIRILNPYTLFFDRESNLWLGGRSGINKLRSMRFATYRQRNGLLRDEVTAITERRNGEMIFGHNGGFTILLNGKTKHIKLSLSDDYYQHDRVLDICTDKSQNVWFAAEKFGIGKLDLYNKITWYKFPGESNYAISVFTDDQGTLYALSENKLYVLINDVFQQINLPQYLNSITFRKILHSSNNEIILASYASGLIIKENGKAIRIIKNNSNEKANSVYSMYSDSNLGTMVGTLNGLYKVDSDSLNRFYQNDFFIDNPVYFITKDNHGIFWFGTDKGVVKWNGSESKEYMIRHGLAGMETNRDAGFIDSNGRLWIGTDRGVSKYLAEFDYKPEISPSILIETIEPQMGIISPSDNVNIEANSSSLVFRVKVISLIDEIHNRFEYQLEGVDKNWNSSSSRYPLIRYVNLPPGNYRLIIRGQNAEGMWSKDYEIGNIKIPLPFYESWWFYLLIIIGGTFLIFSVITYRMNLRYSQKLQLEVDRRTELLAETERRYKHMFELNQAIMLLMDAESLDIIDVNYAAEKFYGYNENSLINMNYRQISRNEPHEELAIKIYECIKKEELFLSKHVLSNGSERIVEVSFSEITIRGRKLFYAIIYDVTERIITESALKESEEKYRTLIESMIDGVFIIQDGKMQFVNNALAGFMGYRPAEILNQNFEKFIAPEDFKMVVERNRARLAGEDVISEYEFNLLHKDGKTRINVLIHVSAFTFKGRVASLGTIKNITESRIQELKIKQFHTAIEQAPVSVMITDINYRIEYVNPTYCKISGYDYEEIIGKQPFILEGKDLSEVSKQIRTEVNKGNIWSGEVLNKRKNGSNYWVMATISPIRNAEGDITHFISVEQDITFEKYAREEIRRNERLLSSIVNHAPVIISAIDKRGFITFIRGKELESLGMKNDELVGINAFEFFKDDPQLIEDFKRAINGEIFSVTRILYDIAFEINFTPIIDDNGDIAGAISVCSNINERYNTEQKLIIAKEEAERSDRLKSDFLAQMSHEIRTPVNTILSFTSLLEEEVKNKIPNELCEVFNFIDDGGRRLIRTIDMILNMSQFQSDTYKPLLEKVDLDKDILYKIVAELRSTAKHKNLALNYFVETKNTSVNGDNYTIGQIFINLIDNAIKYTHHGKIDVRVFENKKNIIVEIDDTGIGISREYIPHLFDAFSQEETGYTRRFEGTGLGLALVKKYLEINNAEIKVESTKNEGTKFSVYFNH